MGTCGQTTAGWQAKKEKIRCYNKRKKKTVQLNLLQTCFLAEVRWCIMQHIDPQVQKGREYDFKNHPEWVNGFVWKWVGTANDLSFNICSLWKYGKCSWTLDIWGYPIFRQTLIRSNWTSACLLILDSHSNLRRETGTHVDWWAGVRFKRNETSRTCLPGLCHRSQPRWWISIVYHSICYHSMDMLLG
jgi:hypothetical protein